MFEVMGKAKKEIHRAGGILYYKDADGILNMMFMVPSNPKYGGDWPQIAKGQLPRKSNLKESVYYENAVREVSEELGLKITNVIRSDLVSIEDRMYLYAFHIRDKFDFNPPDFETKYTVWLTELEVDKIRKHQQWKVYQMIKQVKKLGDKIGSI